MLRKEDKKAMNSTIEQSPSANYFTAPMSDGDITTLAQLLVRYHNSITPERSSLYGEKMDKALCRDTFATLFRMGPYSELCEIRAQFKNS